jgi:NitT/TauT family transport system substrate-binding protein
MVVRFKVGPDYIRFLIHACHHIYNTDFNHRVNIGHNPVPNYSSHCSSTQAFLAGFCNLARQMRLAIAVFVLLGLAAGAARQAAGQGLPVVRVAISDTDLAAEPLYAQETGAFRRAGLNARLSDSKRGGAGVIADIKAGTIDVGFSNLISIAAAVQRGEPVVLIAPAGVHNRNAPVNAIVQAPSTNYRSGADLNGKTISSPSGPGSAGALAPAAWIDQTGGDSRSVHFVTGIAPFDIPAAFREHRIDVAEMGDPDLTILRQRGDVKVLASPFDAIGNGYLLAGFVASKAWVQANPAEARRFVAAMRETARWANTHHPETAVMLSKALKLAPAVVSAMSRTTYAETLTPAIMQPPLDVAAKYGIIKPLNAGELIPDVAKP